MVTSSMLFFFSNLSVLSSNVMDVIAAMSKKTSFFNSCSLL